MGTVRVRLNPRFEQAYRRSAAAKRLLDARAEAVAATARQLAPDDPDTEVEDLKDSITSTTVLTTDGWVGRVSAHNWKAHLWEFGHIHPTRGRRIKPFLRPAAELNGLTLAAGPDDA